MKTAERMQLLVAEVSNVLKEHAKNYVNEILVLIENKAKEGFYEFAQDVIPYSSFESVQNAEFWNTVKSILEEEHGFKVDFVGVDIRISWRPAPTRQA